MTHKQKRKRREEIVKRLQAGESVESLALHYDLVPTYIDTIRRQAGIQKPKKIKPPREKEPYPIAASTYSIIAALLQGQETAEIVKSSGVSRQRIQQIRDRSREAGIL